MINLNAGACVRSLSVESKCDNCEVICPTQAIAFVESNPIPAINHSLCVGCGACDAVCPNEALQLDDFKSHEFFFDFLEDKENLISCRKNVPCIAALNVENLISVAVIKKDIVFDMGHCDECEIAHTCKPKIIENAEEASYLLEAMENKATISLKKVKYEPAEVEDQTSRRDFFRLANLKTVGKVQKNFENEIKKATDELTEHTLGKTDIALLRKKTIPTKRKLFYTAIKRVEKPSQYHVVDATEVSFTSSKLLDSDKCTACQMCYRICPTGALTSDIKNSKIDFDPFVCIKCNTCHDVCEPEALTLSPSYNVKEFFEPSVVNLINFNVKRCNECNMIFSTNDTDAKLCYRCKVEEEEARELWGINEEY
ncbi:4Fe-4S dicluster domain-containing protein [Sulfurimonas lithotrophica]|uniref:4Fe-4S dicluster domain-containing protein n=1 Tax=Sulfurimonas lithotrophica TaxID=2590022 RepID=A0A5P8P090_9BACT|nr:4Fe-4S dicluster domain-containing protein [Sulfurimonas lithotrophica]QFR49104.1 4Fe-4S dicluster domain-containing protein [Sulfurimonas lithotrophica]